MDVGLAPILFVLVVSMTAVWSQILKGPANALKRAGDRVTLECVTVNKNCDQVDWMKVEGMQSPKLVYRTGQGMLNNDLYPRQRYSVNESYGCSLTITRVEISDSGRFMCTQAVGDKEETRTSILVVINVTESCMSNVTSNALDKGDGYRIWCAINVPPKSVEPSNVTLSFHNKTVDETETTDENQPQTVYTTLTGTATTENITERVCRASFAPNTQANYDKTTVTMDVCTTQWIVSYPVENINVSLSDGMLICTADGHPAPTFKWTRLKSEDVVHNDTLEIKGDAEDNYTCTATNTFKGKNESQIATIEVTSDQRGCGPGCVAGAVTGTIMDHVVIGGVVIGGVSYGVWRRSKKKNAVRSQIKKPPANALNKVGDTVTLECVTVNKNCDQVDWMKVEGLQSPKLVYRNGIGMVNNDLYPTQRYSVNSTGGCSLTITLLEIGDFGRFICMQQVDEREETRTAILVVIAVESQIREGPANALKRAGDSVTLKCVTVNKNCDQVEWLKVEGLQSPKLVYRNGQGMLNNDAYPTERYSVIERGGCSLTITQLEMGDSGRFICMHAVDSGEETRTAILVVISVREYCQSNVTSNALDKGDGYSFWCAINIPPKSVEPSNVALSFYNKAVSETETTDKKQLLTVNTTLTGTAIKENITRVVRASFTPITESNYDSTVAFLDVCTTQQLIVLHPVETINVSLVSGTNDTVRCIADGHPPPTFKWTHEKSGRVVYNDTLVITDPGDNYTCTATNTFKGKEASQSITIEVSAKPGCGPDCIGGAVGGSVSGFVIIGGVSYGVYHHSKNKNAVRSQIEKGPVNALKKGGDSVTLQCVTSSSNCYQVEWQKVEGLQSPKLVYRNGTGMLNNDFFPTQRYSVSDRYGCSLTITQLEISDSGRFICVHAVGDVEDTRISILVVIDPVDTMTASTPMNTDPVENVTVFKPTNTDPVETMTVSTPTETFKLTEVSESIPTEVSPPPTPSRPNPVEHITVSTYGDTLQIKVDAEDEFTLTATNMVKGGVASQIIPIEVYSPPFSPLANVRSQIQRGPTNALKEVGDCVTLECVTANKNCDQVEWQKVEGLQSPRLVYRYGQGMVNNSTYPPQRYSVSDRYGCSLTITRLEISDSGRFICVHGVGDKEETRTAILVVIDVAESCESNVTSNELAKGDAYSHWCAINIPPKSVEPSNVTLSFHNKIVGETETTGENQPLTIKATLTGIAKMENITPRVCRASFPPSAQANYDDTVAFLDVCTTQPFIVSSVWSQIQRGPTNALKRGEANVTLECVTVNKNCDKVEWQKVEGLQSPKLVYRNGHGMLNNDLYPPQRYSVNERNGCNLTITQLESNDSGRFLCVHAVDGVDYNRGSILVVIGVAESCLSNVTSNSLDKGDGYSLRCTIKVPAKSVEPSNVTLSFHDKTVGETETTDEKQPLTVKTTLTGIAKKENITHRVIRASLPPNTQTNYDNTTAFLDVCTTERLIVAYPVENINVSLSGDTAICTADGHPPPTFKWTRLKNDAVVYNDTQVITDPGENYTCTATNMFKGKEASQSFTIEVSAKPGCGPGCVAGVVVGSFLGFLVIGGVSYGVWKKKNG